MEARFLSVWVSGRLSLTAFLVWKRESGYQSLQELTHWGRVTHICVRKPTIIGSDNGLSPDRRQTIIWTNAGILLIAPLWTNFNEISIKIHTFSFKKMHLKMSSAKWRPFCLGFNELNLCMPVLFIYIQGTKLVITNLHEKNLLNTSSNHCKILCLFCNI